MDVVDDGGGGGDRQGRGRFDELRETVTNAIIARGARRRGHELVLPCFVNPSAHKRGDRDWSWRWSPTKGCFNCKPCRAKGGTLDAARLLGVRFNEQHHRRAKETVYPYHDGDGRLVFEVVRTEYPNGKRIAQRRPHRSDDDAVALKAHGVKCDAKWVWSRKRIVPAAGRCVECNLSGHMLVAVDTVLYRLPELRKAAPDTWIVIAEGEKTAEAARRLGFVATTNPEGAGKWRSEFTEELRDHKVAIFDDNDDPGHRHGDVVERDVARVATAGVRLRTLPGITAEGGDLADWIDAGGTREQLLELIEAGPRVALDVEKAASADDGGEAAPSARFFFDKKGRFVPAIAGERLIAECPVLLGRDRRLWRYTNGVYRPDGDDWARYRVRQLVGHRFKRSQLDEVCAYLRAELPTLGHEPPKQFINCTNGLLDWKTGTLHPHSPDVVSTNQIPVAWKPDATAPRFIRFLSDVVPHDAVGAIEEVMGYALYAGNPFRKAVLLLGPGGNGKSVLLRLFATLLGEENVSSVPLHALADDRFAAAHLFGKLANICGDLDATSIKRTDYFKQITGGDLIYAQHKFRDAFAFMSYALPIFSANQAPATADQSEAWFDRWITIPMPRRFEGTPDADPDLTEKLAAEREGVLVRAVAGLQRLMARRHFFVPDSLRHAHHRYRQTLDTVQAFVTEQCHFDGDAWVDRTVVRKRYDEWCRDEGRIAVSATVFNARLRTTCGSKIAPRKRNGYPGWRGLALGPDPTAADEGDEGDDASTSTNRRGSEGGGVAEKDSNGVTFVPPVPRDRDVGIDDDDDRPIDLPPGEAARELSPDEVDRRLQSRKTP